MKFYLFKPFTEKNSNLLSSNFITSPNRHWIDRTNSIFFKFAPVSKKELEWKFQIRKSFISIHPTMCIASFFKNLSFYFFKICKLFMKMHLLKKWGRSLGSKILTSTHILRMRHLHRSSKWATRSKFCWGLNLK